MQRLSSFTLVVAVAIAFTASPASASGLGAQPVLADIFDSMFQDLADGLREASTWLLQQVLMFIQSAPQPDFLGSDGWYRDQYGTMLRIAIWLIVPFVIVATIQAILKGGIAAVAKVILVGIPIAALGSFIAIAVISLLVEIDNDISNALLGTLYDDYQGYLQNLANAPSASGVGYLFGQIILLFAMAIGSILVFLELIFRTIALYCTVLFLPMAFAAWVWQPSRGFYSKLATMTCALVFSKSVIIAVMALGFAAVRFAFGDGLADGGDDTRSHVGAIMAGIVIFFFASASVPALISLVLGADALPVTGAGGELTRKQVIYKSPAGADTRFTFGAYRDALTFGQYDKWRGRG